jgi:hypothetical protein
LRGTSRAPGVRAGSVTFGSRRDSVLETQFGPFDGDDDCLARGRSPPACWRETGATSRCFTFGWVAVHLATRLLRGLRREIRWVPARVARQWHVDDLHRFRAVGYSTEGVFRARFAVAFGRLWNAASGTRSNTSVGPSGLPHWVATDSSEYGRDLPETEHLRVKRTGTGDSLGIFPGVSPNSSGFGLDAADVALRDDRRRCDRS